MAEREGNLAVLADTLIARHLRTSLPDITVRVDVADEQQSSLYPRDAVELLTRCIAVVGAGASEPLCARADELATKLEEDFGRDDTELERLELVSGFDPKAFETRLIALSRTPEAASQVRDTISEEYNIRHPALLGYELLAHLLKHRFLDAIISFNFDELLDRSLDDELSKDEYRRVVSERDCAEIQTDADSPKYVPLYVKLHGTASEPQSLRFTPDSYYALPKRMVKVVQDLLDAERCVIIVAGSGLASFDFQRLLRIQELPKQLDVFNLSFEPLSRKVISRIDKDRRPSPKVRAERWLYDCSQAKGSPHEPLQELTNCVQSKSGATGISNLVEFRSVLRHVAVTTLLGTDTVQNQSKTMSSWSKPEEIRYIKRRTILELALAGARARGLLSLVPLVGDRPARYYETYQQLTDGRSDGWSWRALCSAAGLWESEDTPDILVSNKTLRAKPDEDTRAPSERLHLHEFDPKKLALHLLPVIKNQWLKGDREILESTITELQEESEVEIHTNDDRVCSKAFTRPAVLATATSLQTYTWLMLRDLEPEDRVYISSETGAWILREPVLKMLRKPTQIRTLLAFAIEKGKLKDKYKDRLVSKFVDPWRHNRHMTIVCKKNEPVRAIYFARRLRTPFITPVYLDDLGDVKLLMRMYEERWREAKPDRADTPKK